MKKVVVRKVQAVKLSSAANTLYGPTCCTIICPF